MDGALGTMTFIFGAMMENNHIGMTLIHMIFGENRRCISAGIIMILEFCTDHLMNEDSAKTSQIGTNFAAPKALNFCPILEVLLF